MFFLENLKNLAQKLQKSALLVLLSVFFIFPMSGLFANESDLPVIIPADELLTPIELRDGLVLEVKVPDNTELTFEKISPQENQLTEDYISFDESPLERIIFTEVSTIAKGSVKESGFSSKIQTSGISKASIVFEKGPEHFSVKSIASPGLFGFLGICLSRSELPSKNSSMLCENSQLKSMTRRSANDWKFSWQPVRTISQSLWSTNSCRILRTSILSPSMSHILSMSDISSTWSNATEGSPVTFWLEKKTNLPVIAQVTNQQKNNLRVVLRRNVVHPNPQVL